MTERIIRGTCLADGCDEAVNCEAGWLRCARHRKVQINNMKLKWVRNSRTMSGSWMVFSPTGLPLKEFGGDFDKAVAWARRNREFVR